MRFACSLFVLFGLHFDPAHGAQSLTKVLEFGGPNQAQTGLIEGPGGTFYAWDRNSDTNRTGSIFSLGKFGSGAAPIHAFTGTPTDGDTPSCLILGSDAWLYGVAVDTQARTRGRVFALSSDGNIYRTLRRWDAATNEHGSPFGLIEGTDQALYGVAQPGGTLGSDTIWKINKDGSGYTVLHDFEAGVASPNTTVGPSLGGNLTEARDGELYGVVGGNFGVAGAVFRLKKDGSSFEVIHQFTRSGEGGGPFGRLLHASNGFLYGIGSNGGTGNKAVVYRMHLDGTDFHVLASGEVASFDPNNRLVESSDGYLYGTCANGGQFVAGLLYRLPLDGGILETLHEFNLLAQPPLGIQPTALLPGSDANVYFTTLQQVTFVGQGTSRPFLLRFGPVPLPPPISDTPPLALSSTISTAGPNSIFGLSFMGTPGAQYEIQTTSTLPASWLSAQKVKANASGNVAFQTNIPSSVAAQFFRVAQ